MRTFTVFRPILILILLISPAFAANKDLACDIRMDFMTHTTGIDSVTYTTIMTRILATPAITEKHAENLNLSGERTLCLTVKPGELDNVYEDLKTLVPTESKNYVTKITAKNGRSFESHQPVKFQRNPYFK